MIHQTRRIGLTCFLVAALGGCASPSSSRLAITLADGGTPEADATTAVLVPTVLPGEPCLGRAGRFETVAVGDFDGDGRRDVAFGAPRTMLYEEPGAGSVVVFRGIEGGELTGWVRLDEGELATPAVGEAFGSALAVGDFDGDGFDDLAAGAPEEKHNGVIGQGIVVVYRGGPEGLVPWTTLRAIGGSEAEEDDFGAALAAGDVDGDGRDELVVGAPRQPLGGRAAVGRLSVFRGTPSGLTPGYLLDVANAWEVSGSPELGARIVMGDFTGDGRADLVVSGRETAGDRNAVVVAFVSRPYLPAEPGPRRSLVLPRSTPRRLERMATLSADSIASGELGGFGDALALADLTGDGIGDVVVGAPDTTLPTLGRAGALYVFAGPSLAPARELSFPTVGARLGASLAAGDLDADGRADLAASSSEGTILYRQGSTGSLGLWAVLDRTSPRAIDDLDGDGDGDLLGPDVALRGRRARPPLSWRTFSVREPGCLETWGVAPEISRGDRSSSHLTFHVTPSPGTAVITTRLGSRTSERHLGGQRVTVTYRGLQPDREYCIEAFSRLEGVADSTETTRLCARTDRPPPPDDDDDDGGGGGGGGEDVVRVVCLLGFDVCEPGWHPVRFDVSSACGRPSPGSNNATICARDEGLSFPSCGRLNCPDGYYTSRVDDDLRCRMLGTEISGLRSLCVRASGFSLLACGRCPTGYEEVSSQSTSQCDGYRMLTCRRR